MVEETCIHFHEKFEFSFQLHEQVRKSHTLHLSDSDPDFSESNLNSTNSSDTSSPFFKGSPKQHDKNIKSKSSEQNVVSGSQGLKQPSSLFGIPHEVIKTMNSDPNVSIQCEIPPENPVVKSPVRLFSS